MGELLLEGDDVTQTLYYEPVYRFDFDYEGKTYASIVDAIDGSVSFSGKKSKFTVRAESTVKSLSYLFTVVSIGLSAFAAVSSFGCFFQPSGFLSTILSALLFCLPVAAGCIAAVRMFYIAREDLALPDEYVKAKGLLFGGLAITVVIDVLLILLFWNIFPNADLKVFMNGGF